MGERVITFENVFNFRDLGGYPAADGRTVRWGRLFRADDLGRLNGNDVESLRRLGVRTVVDLRRPVEIERLGRVPDAGFTYQHAYMRHPEWEHAEHPTPQSRVDYLVERYMEMAHEGGEAVGEALRTIADPDAAPLVFHCIAGKDRTGLVAALTLTILGVADEDVADDYALSEAAQELNFAWYAARDPEHTDRRWERYAVTPREAMLTLFTSLRERHGSLDAYLGTIGVTGDHADAMRAHLLEP